jgi:hypothetical protein
LKRSFKGIEIKDKKEKEKVNMKTLKLAENNTEYIMSYKSRASLENNPITTPVISKKTTIKNRMKPETTGHMAEGVSVTQSCNLSP